jgi:hypothetical protein
LRHAPPYGGRRRRILDRPRGDLHDRRRGPRRRHDNVALRLRPDRRRNTGIKHQHRQQKPERHCGRSNQHRSRERSRRDARRPRRDARCHRFGDRRSPLAHRQRGIAHLNIKRLQALPYLAAGRTAGHVFVHTGALLRVQLSIESR